jgi:hypothetical protein
MKIKNSQLRCIIREEIQRERISTILNKERKRIDILHEEIEKLLFEFQLADVGHFALDIGGLIPGIGEVADLANAALYARKGEFLMAALSIIAMIPGVGDVIGKGGKLAMSMGKGGKVAKMLKGHMPKIKKLIGGLADNPKVGKFANQMLKSVDDFVVKTLNNPRSQEALQGLQKLASTRASTPLKGGKLAKIKNVAAKAQQKRATQQNLKKTAQAIQGPQTPTV